MIYAYVVFYEQSNKARNMFKCSNDTAFINWYIKNQNKINHINVSREELPLFYDPLIPGYEEYQDIIEEQIN